LNVTLVSFSIGGSRDMQISPTSTHSHQLRDPLVDLVTSQL